MTAVDTNILIYAHRPESPWHTKAMLHVTNLAEGAAPWAIPWPCVHEFLAVVTNPKVFKSPTPVSLALDQVECWLESPSLVLLGESPDHWKQLKTTVASGKVVGPVIHDARIVAICREQGVATLYSADRDFSRFSGLKVVNPLLDS